MATFTLQRLASSCRRRPAIALGCVGFVVAAAVAYATVGRGSAAVEPTGRVDRQQGRYHPTTAQWASLSVQTIERQEFRTEIVTEGKTTINDDRATRLYSSYAGRVTKLLVGPGDTVRQGQPVFVVDAADFVDTQKDFVAALTSLNKARSQVNLAQIVERRMEALYKDKAMAIKDWQEAQANLNAAQNDFRSADVALKAVRNRLRLLGKTEEEIDTFEQTGVIAPEAPVFSPIAGTVLQRKVGPGQYVNAGASDGDPVFLIGDVSKLWLVAYVRASDAAKVKVGQPIKFTVLTYPDRVFEAKINFVGSTFDLESRRLLVRATIDNEDGLLKPEVFASVSIAVDDAASSPAVPRDAILYEGDRARVWVAGDGGAIELRRIKTGITSKQAVQVVEGLSPGDKVVTQGSLFIDRAAALAN